MNFTDHKIAGAAGLLRACSMMALLAGTVVLAPATAMAQTSPADDPAEPRETEDSPEIVISGVRASLAASQEAKRAADSIVDVVTAEDIGKFPDQNVAETLQRVPGVAIDRQAGEGRFASVNGLGPEFVSVLVNGRSIANDNPDRSFSFDTLASELVSTVKVYKSANAIIPEGGVGGTIDVVTARPFDHDGFVFSAKIGGLYEENSEKLTPQGSFLISDRFMDGRLGILASFNYSERRNRTHRVQNSAIIPNIFFDFNSYAYVADEAEDAFRMQDLERAVDEEKRTRISGTLAVQYEVADGLELTADYLHSKLDIKGTTNSVMNWFYAVQDNDRNIRDDAGVYTSFDHSLDANSSGYAFVRSERYRPVETNALGLNARWTMSDTLSGVFDLSGSRTVNDNRGRDRDYTVEALNQGGFLVVTDGGVPSLQGPNLYVPSDTNMSPLRARITSDSGTYVKSENWQFRSDFTFSASDAIKFNFGGSYASQRKQNEFWQTPNAIRRMYHGNATGQAIDTGSIISGILQPGNVFGNSDLNSDMFIVDGQALRDWMADPVNLANRTRNATAGGLAEFIANGRTWNAVKSGDSYTITEKVTSAYVDAHLGGEFLSKPFEIVAGLRFTHTDLASDGTTRILVDLVSDELAGILAPVYASDDLDAVTVRNRYSNWLPSLNARWDLAKDVVVRVGVSKTLTRPLLESLAPQISYRSLFDVARFATASNPNLRPFTAFNFDASAEWYYGKASGISVAYFRKRIDDYIVETVGEEVIATVQTPAYRTFQVTRPRNAEKASVDGVTGQWTQTFDFGLGFQANYTMVSGDVSSTSDPSLNFELPGVSDTANLTGFFEKGPIGLRVAYNWRDSFTAQPNYGGYTNAPRVYKEFSQIDARVSLAMPYGVGLALDVVNLTGKKVYSHGVSENAFISYQDYGRRFTLTASKRF